MGLTGGLGIAAAALAPAGVWLGRQQLGMMGDLLPAPIWHLAGPLGALALTAALGVLRRDRLVLRLSILLLVAVLACVFSYAQIRGLAFAYLAAWVRAIAMLCWIAPLIALARGWDRAQPAEPDRATRTAALRTSAIALVLAVLGARALVAPAPDELRSRVLERFADAIATAVPPHTVVRVAALGPPFAASAEALAVVLKRAGREPRLAFADPSVCGAHRCAPSDAVLPMIALAAGPGIDVYRAQGGRVIAEHDPLWPAHRALANELRARLEIQLAQGQRADLVMPLRDAAEWLPGVVPATVDPRDLATFLELAAGLDHLPFAVFLFPPNRL